MSEATKTRIRPVDCNHYNIRHRGYPLLHMEIAWFATEGDNVLGVVILDLRTHDYGWVLLAANDQDPGFTSVDVYFSLPDQEAATLALHEAMESWPVLRGWEREVEYDIGPASDVPDLRGKNFEDAVELVVDWFHSNFEDPAENMPFESAEGGYFWIWGGPYEARDQIESAFGCAISEAILEEAVTQIEYGGWDWAPSSSRMQPEEVARRA